MPANAYAVTELRSCGIRGQATSRKGFETQRFERLSPEVAKAGGPCEIRLHVFTAALVDNLAPTGIANVGQAVAGRRQVASNAVDAFPEHDLDRIQAFVQDDDINALSGSGNTHPDLFVIHVRGPKLNAARNRRADLPSRRRQS